MMKKKYSIKIWAIIFWLCFWHMTSLIIGKEILIVSPVKVIERLGQLVMEAEFWKSICFTFFRILLGFLSASNNKGTNLSNDIRYKIYTCSFLYHISSRMVPVP